MTDSNQPTSSRPLHTFQYTSLVDCERPGCSPSIRLLELLPTARGSTIETCLKTSTLTYHQSHEAWYVPQKNLQQPSWSHEFAALSYEWGSSAGTSTILVNGEPFSVQQNLHNFLLQIHHHRCRSRSITLWVDSICINQEDIEEKNRQVGIMHQIYAKATEVLVWLGETADSSDRLCLCFREFLAFVEEHEHYYRSKQSFSLRTGHVHQIGKDTDAHFMRNKVEVRELFNGDTDLMNALLKLCRRSYWTRAWIIQECLQAKAVSLFCGSETLPHNAFPLLGSMCDQLMKTSTSSMNSILSVWKETPSSPDPAKRVTELTSRWNIQRHSGLESLLFSYHGSACSVPHDKVYAFLGLSSVPGEFNVDYGAPLELLLAQTITFCSASKQNWRQSRIDPVRATCDSIRVAQLLSRDLALLEDRSASNLLGRCAFVVPDSLMDGLVTIELDYLGTIKERIDSSDLFNANEFRSSRRFKINMHEYVAEQPRSYVYGDRVFALRGTPIVLIYRRTLSHLHFIGIAILSDMVANEEGTPLLAENELAESISLNLNNGETDGTPAALKCQTFTTHALDPIANYTINYGQSLLIRMARDFILPLLPKSCWDKLMFSTPDSAFFASPSCRVPLRFVLETVVVYPQRVRGYEDYFQDLQENRQIDTSDILTTVWIYIIDMFVRSKNSVLFRLGTFPYP